MSRIFRAAAAVTTAAAAVTVAASPASAWTGGSITATAAPVQFSGFSVTCVLSTLNGTVTPAGALSITTASFTGCTLPNNTPITVTAGPSWGGFLGSTTSLTNVKISFVFPLSGGGSFTCSYGSSLSGTPAGTTPPVAVPISSLLNKVAVSSFLCPANTTLSATYVFTGPGL